MDVQKVIDSITLGKMDDVIGELEGTVKSGNQEEIVALFKRYEDAIAEYIENNEDKEELEEKDVVYGLGIYKGISFLTVALGKILGVDNFEAIDDAYELEDYSQGYLEDYEYFIENFVEDESEIKAFDELLDEAKEIFTAADFEANEYDVDDNFDDEDDE